MDGVLVVDKPAGMTSHDVVDEIRRRLGTKKVGHAGTLDPDATGVLVIGVGKATRFLSYAQDTPKRYSASARFGVSTSTQDASGEVIATRECSFSDNDLRRVLEKFTGEIEQIPPMVSAVSIGGERLHVKARRGEEIERAPRRVTVHELSLMEFRAGKEPEADLEVLCSSGTYVRTLIHDIGETLGCGAHMTVLRRTETGGFPLSDARPLEQVSASDLLPVAAAVRALPSLDLGNAEAEDVRHGRKLSASLAPDLPEGGSIALRTDGELSAVYRRSGNLLAAERVVSA
jgi:tRNA pseudouridine55 synthase